MRENAGQSDYAELYRNIREKKRTAYFFRADKKICGRFGTIVEKNTGIMRDNAAKCGKMEKRMRSFRNMEENTDYMNPSLLTHSISFPLFFFGAIANSQNYYYAQPPFFRVP